MRVIEEGIYVDGGRQKIEKISSTTSNTLKVSAESSTKHPIVVKNDVISDCEVKTGMASVEFKNLVQSNSRAAPTSSVCFVMSPIILITGGK